MVVGDAVFDGGDVPFLGGEVSLGMEEPGFEGGEAFLGGLAFEPETFEIRAVLVEEKGPVKMFDLAGTLFFSGIDDAADELEVNGRGDLGGASGRSEVFHGEVGARRCRRRPGGSRPAAYGRLRWERRFSCESGLPVWEALVGCWGL